jgi:hypothetical protein
MNPLVYVRPGLVLHVIAGRGAKPVEVKLTRKHALTLLADLAHAIDVGEA